MVKLKLDWCTHEAAKYAVNHWHYSEKMPKAKLSRIGVWEDGRFVGAVIYGLGAGSSTDGTSYGFRKSFDVAELVRVALRSHETPTSRIVAISIKMLRKANPGLKMLISFADQNQGHQGIIYQASGWIYAGEYVGRTYMRIRGENVHTKTVYMRYGKTTLKWIQEHIDPSAYKLNELPKHRYLFPMSKSIRKHLEKFRKPFPSARSDTIDTQAVQA